MPGRAAIGLCDRVGWRGRIAPESVLDGPALDLEVGQLALGLGQPRPKVGYLLAGGINVGGKGRQKVGDLHGDSFGGRVPGVTDSCTNVETTFSMIKAKFGDSLRARSFDGQVNEVLCKVIAHNLVCVISAMYELGIEPPRFAPERTPELRVVG